MGALHERGVGDAWLYGVDQPGTGGLNAFFLLVDRPEVYGLPPDPVAPSKKARSAWLSLAVAAAALAAVAAGSAALGRGEA